MPISVVMPEAFVEDNQYIEQNPCFLVQAADHFKINLMAVQPLYHGLLSHTPLPTSQLLSKHLHVKHINLIRSLPYDAIKSVTVGMHKNRHVKLNLGIGQIPKATPENIENVLLTPRRRVIEMEEEVGYVE